MKRLQRKSLYTQDNALDVRVEQLERRIPVDFPQWGSFLTASITKSAAGSYPFNPAFPDPVPCDLPDCDSTDWRNDGNYLLAPLGVQSICEIFMTFALLGGNSNLDDYYTVLDAADQSINGQCRIRVEAEIWRDDAPFGTITGRGYSTWNEMPPPTGLFLDRYWTHHTLIANNSFTFDVSRDRFAFKPVFDINQALPGVIQVSGTMSVNIQPPMQRVSGMGGLT